MISKRIKREF